jgi:uncharacterized membrane protein
LHEHCQQELLLDFGLCQDCADLWRNAQESAIDDRNEKPRCKTLSSRWMTSTRRATRGPRGRSDLLRQLNRIGNRVSQLPLHLVFVAFALAVGIFLVFAQPPGQGLDETVHFYRVWSLAHGSLVAPRVKGEYGGYVSQCVVDYLKRFSTDATRRSAFSFANYWQTPHCPTGSPFVAFPASAVYSLICYLPSVIVVAILAAVHAPLPVIFFLGRLASLLVFVALMSLAIRIIPVGKQVVFVLGLLPTTMLLASCYSADPMTLALAVLSVSLLLRLLLSAEPTSSDFLFLLAALVGLALAKPTFFIFAPLLFMVPSTVFVGWPRILGRWTSSALIKTASVVITLVVAGLWYIAVRNALVAPVPAYGLNAHVQTHLILHHPVHFGEIFLRTLFFGKPQLEWVAGFFFSIGYQRPFHDSIYAPLGLVVLGTVVLWYAFHLQFGVRRVIERSLRILAWLPIVVMAIGVVLVVTTLFVYGTPVGSSVSLIQGRYLYEFVPLPIITIGLYRQPRNVRHSTRWIVLGVAVMLVWLVVKIFVHDYSL